MRKDVQKILDSLNGAEQHELHLAIDFALAVQRAKIKYKKTDAELAIELGANKKKMKSFLSGSYPYDIKHWAAYEAFIKSMQLEENMITFKNAND